VIEWIPTLSVDVLKLIFPAPSSGPVPRTDVPSLKVMVPVGTTPPDAGLTVAVKVRLVPLVTVVAVAVKRGCRYNRGG